MLLQPIGNSDPKERFHVSSGMGKAMIAAGIAEEYLPPVKPWQPTKWGVALGAMQGLYPPVVQFSCPNCGSIRHNESNKGTAHTNEANTRSLTKSPLVYTHCNGVQEEIPESVSKDYQRLWMDWRKEFQPKLLAKEERERQIAAAQGVTYVQNGRR
jgi:hypothetical protein